MGTNERTDRVDLNWGRSRVSQSTMGGKDSFDLVHAKSQTGTSYSGARHFRYVHGIVS
jgi:hypothetical protein